MSELEYMDIIDDLKRLGVEPDWDAMGRARHSWFPGREVFRPLRLRAVRNVLVKQYEAAMIEQDIRDWTSGR